MDGYLRQSTASQVRTIGPFVDDVDFKTAEDGLTIANTDIKLKKNGAASGNKNSGGATADGTNGQYHLTWDATDTGTVGELKYSVKVAGALIVFGSYVVLEEAVYDALFAASALGYVANAPVVLADGVAHGGTPGSSTATLALKQINVTNSAGHALVASSTGSNGSGLLLTGNGSGAGVYTEGGATGYGLHAKGGATSGGGGLFQGQAGNSDGLEAIGQGSADGFLALGGATGVGLRVTGGATSGAAAVFAAQAGNSDGITATKTGSGKDINATLDVVTTAVNLTTNNDKTGYALSTAGVQAIWDALTSALTAVGSIGKLLVDNINATISSRSSHSAADVWASATRTLTSFGTLAADVWAVATRTLTSLAGNAADIRSAVGLASANLDTQLDALPTAAETADAVWDEAIAGHLTAGSTGAALNAAGSAGDPWATALPGAYGAGTAGKIVGENLNATVSSRATQTSVDDLPTNAELATALAAADDPTLAAIAALNDLSQGDIRTAVGLATNNLDTQLGDLPTNAELAMALAAADDAVLAAIAALNNVSAAQVKAQVVAALATDTYAEPAAVPAATASLTEKVGWLMLLARNRVLQTATQQTVRNDADSGDVATAAVSDDGSTFERSAWL